MASSSAPHKKRKRDSAAQDAPISVSTAESLSFPPILAASRGITLPETSFKPYSRPSADAKRPRPSYLLHGPSSRIDYIATPSSTAEDDVQRHYIGIFDPASCKMELHAAPKLSLFRSIKAQRQRDRDVEARGSQLSYEDARTALGKEFGTRKAQKALHAREINRIDHSAMEKDVSVAIAATVHANTKDLPTTAMLGSQMTDGRPVPAHDAAATAPGEAYARSAVISDEEWDALDVGLWLKHASARSSSEFVNRRAALLLGDAAAAADAADARKHVRELKILRYVAYAIEFFKAQAGRKGRLPHPSTMQRTLGNAPQVVVEGFYARFAEQTQSGAKESDARYQVSPALGNKLLYYLAVCCLMADQYDVDTFDLKSDLGLLPREVNEAFKQVGCAIRDLTAQQVTALKLTKAEAAQHKRAVLKIPLEFPAPPRRRAAAAVRR